MKFKAQGHKNIQATHKTTLEFTKDTFVTKKGDCIIGIKANYKLEELKELKCKKIKMTIECNGKNDVVVGELNKEFDDDREMVIRMGTYKSPRTFLIRANKSAKYLNRELIEEIKKDKEIKIEVQCEKTTQ